MEPWKESPAYSELMQAYHSRNHYHFLTQITRLVANSFGEERAFWLRTQNAYLVEACAETNEYQPAWDHLESVVQTAADDSITQETILLLALALLHASEDSGRYVAVRARLRSLPPESRVSWKVLRCRGLVCLAKGYWSRARNVYAKAIAALAAEPEGVLKHYKGYFVHLYSIHAIACFATGQPHTAAASIREADALMTEARRAYVYPLPLARAKAEFHLLQGEFQQARMVLQTAHAWIRSRPIPMVAMDQVAMLMLVARITRAEGNQEGFRHFCDQALALCHQYHLPFSEARVNALLAGAER